MYTIDDAWEDAALWMRNYRDACPEDDRTDIDIYLDGETYTPDSPYWPLRDANGTFIDWKADRATYPASTQKEHP